MSSTKPTGGSAFPHPVPVGAWGDPSQGMLLRDYFAAKAIEGAAFNVCDFAASDMEQAAHAYARAAYLLADAMLAARAEVKP